MNRDRRSPIFEEHKGSPRSAPARPEPHGGRRRSASEPAPASPPVIGVSHRAGHGYDVHALSPLRVDAVSSPPHLPALAPRASPQATYQNERAAHEARLALLADAPSFRRHLDGLDGVYIPGGQDVPSEVPGAQQSRLDYEAALLRAARTRGMPVLGICGGSRRVAAAYGVPEVQLSGAALEEHNQRGTSTMAHGLSFPDEHSTLGGYRPGAGKPRLTKVNQINSTHSKVVGTAPEPVVLPWSVPTLANVETVRAPHHNPFQFGSLVRPTVETRDTPLLSVTALEPTRRTPEGFETSFGAPHIGVTSHPEAIAGGSRGAHDAAAPDARAWSQHVMKSFEQASQTYRNRKAVNAELLTRAAARRSQK